VGRTKLGSSVVEDNEKDNGQKTRKRRSIASCITESRNTEVKEEEKLIDLKRRGRISTETRERS
jgi:hypothetical protein